MKNLAALGIAGGFLFGVGEWLLLLVVLRVATKVSDGLAVAILKEVLKARVVK